MVTIGLVAHCSEATASQDTVGHRPHSSYRLNFVRSFNADAAREVPDSTYQDTACPAPLPGTPPAQVYSRVS
ncbi:uncharacterized protein RMCC_2973 [Mycolicibacterium canariasense]|uniref:Uncharacterized protein n=1 Tax=Mycolicibacterium canariasense TaxID=228230 RepID=A0A100WCJ5_MYCCR|nr:uncharacterized protein RMCC_2973 [Mycolicibacterium canariasense]